MFERDERCEHLDLAILNVESPTFGPRATVPRIALGQCRVELTAAMSQTP